MNGIASVLLSQSRREAQRGLETLVGSKGGGPRKAAGLQEESSSGGSNGQTRPQGRRVEPRGGAKSYPETDVLQESRQPPTRHKAVGNKNLTIVLIFETGPYFVPQAGVKPTVPFHSLPNAGTASP